LSGRAVLAPFQGLLPWDIHSQGVALGCIISAFQAEERTPAHLASGQSDTVLRLPCLERYPNPQNPCNVATVPFSQVDFVDDLAVFV
jgi:hypothetical protein